MQTDSGLLTEKQILDYQEFIEVTNTPNIFFDILPADWSEGIAPVWTAYSSTSRIFCLKMNGQIVGGGIVFRTIAPDTLDEALAQTLYDDGLLYIGFLWISEEFRGCNLGSMWKPTSINLDFLRPSTRGASM